MEQTKEASWTPSLGLLLPNSGTAQVSSIFFFFPPLQINTNLPLAGYGQVTSVWTLDLGSTVVQDVGGLRQENDFCLSYPFPMLEQK